MPGPRYSMGQRERWRCEPQHTVGLPPPRSWGPPCDHDSGRSHSRAGRAVAVSALGRVSWVEERTAEVRNIPRLRTSGQGLEGNLGGEAHSETF